MPIEEAIFLKRSVASRHMELFPDTTANVVQLYSRNKEITDLDTFEFDGIVLANVGNSLLKATFESRHF